MLHRWGVSVQNTYMKAVVAGSRARASFSTRTRLALRSHPNASGWSNHFTNAPKRRLLSSSAGVAAEKSEEDAASYDIEDEYNACAHAGARSSTFRLRTPLALEKGGQLEGVEVAYTTYGTLNAARDNVIVLCHALTGDSLVHQYWDSMVTPKWTDNYFVVCSNILGSCYGTTGPASINPATQKPYGASFPAVTMRDAARLQKKLLQEELGVQQVRHRFCFLGIDSLFAVVRES